MIYVALLRGINVGGKNKIDMKKLKLTFEQLGMKNVVTYINSGNVVFVNDQCTGEEVKSVIKQAIKQDFSLDIDVIIVSMTELSKIINALPDDWKNDKDMKSDVLFLRDDIDDENVLKQLTVQSEIDTVIYVPGAVLWSVYKSDLTKSGMMKLAGSSIYKKMTIRNVNSTRKIYDIMLRLNQV